MYNKINKILLFNNSYSRENISREQTLDNKIIKYNNPELPSSSLTRM
jgi:hypothetical protein